MSAAHTRLTHDTHHDTHHDTRQWSYPSGQREDHLKYSPLPVCGKTSPTRWRFSSTSLAMAIRWYTCPRLPPCGTPRSSHPCPTCPPRFRHCMCAMRAVRAVLRAMLCCVLCCVLCAYRVRRVREVECAWADCTRGHVPGT